MPRILVADDHALMRRKVRDLLETEAGWEVCGEATNGREAIEMASCYKPEVVVLDLSMPEVNGLEATREILKQAPQTEVLILTMHDAKELQSEALASGARACVMKSHPQHLIAAVRALSQYRLHSSSTPAVRSGGNPTDRSADGLSEGEREIVQLLARAKTSREIAASLSVSVEAVETRRVEIMRKLKINSLLDLVQYAVRNKLVEVKSASALAVQKRR